MTDLVQTGVRRHADWMAQPDDRLLEHLLLEGVRRRFQLREEFAERDLHYPDKYLEFRLEKLREHGLVSRRRNGAYAITDDGRAYLAGEGVPDSDEGDSVESRA